MQIEYEDSTYEFAFDDITLDQALIIKDKLKLTLVGIDEGIATGDPDALRAAYWVMLEQAGIKSDLMRVRFLPVKFRRAWMQSTLAAYKAATEQGDDAANPTNGEDRQT
jgi:hypothetical protein